MKIYYVMLALAINMYMQYMQSGSEKLWNLL